MSGYPYSTKAWRDLRRAKLSSQPTCEVCERRGRTVLAVAVDHIVAIAKGGEPFPPLAGLMSMCAACHNSKTARMDRGNSKGASRFKGCDINGDPLDPDDDWYTEPQVGPPARETQDMVDDTSQATNACVWPRMAVSGPIARPGGFAGREAAAEGPSVGTKTELVPANDSQLETDRWV